MSAFRELKNVCNRFEDELRRASQVLCVAKAQESFEDNIAKKLRDLSLLQSKLRLLRAKPISLTPQISDPDRDEDSTLADYRSSVATRIIEHQLVKSATQTHAVKTLLSTPDHQLTPEMLKRKQNITMDLFNYQIQETVILELDRELQTREDVLAETQAQWDQELQALNEIKSQNRNNMSNSLMIQEDPLQKRLSKIVDKLELMRRMISQLGIPRSRGYDWLADSQRRLAAIKHARKQYSVQGFMQS